MRMRSELLVVWMFISLIVFVTNVSHSFGVSCPVVPANCSCSRNNRTLICSGLQQIPSIQGKAGLNFELTEVKFLAGQISSVGPKSLPSGVISLEFQDNPLADVSDDAFDNIAPNLTELTISGAAFTIPPPALFKLTELTDLNIFKSSLEKWYEPTLGDTRDNGMPSSFVKLFSLGLIENKITKVDFSHFPSNLTFLYLSMNQITEIRYSRDLFSPGHFSNLQELDMAYNELTTLCFDDFPPDIKSIDLEYNKISRISDSKVEITSQLRSLSLHNNPVTSISPGAFRNLANLDYLNLEQTALTQLPEALTSLTSLTQMLLWRVDLICPCPAPDSLVQWFASVSRHLDLKNGECQTTKASIKSYLTNYCDTVTSASSTPKGNTVMNYTPKNGAPAAQNLITVLINLIYAFLVVCAFYV